MLDIYRDSPVGQCLRLLTRKRIGKYPEEDVRFDVSCLFTDRHDSAESRNDESTSPEEDIERGQQGGGYGSSQTPTKAEHGVHLVAWYSDSDPDNPQNWSSGKKLWIGMILFAYTFAAYIGSSLYTVSEPAIEEIFDISETAAAAGLTVYVLGYGVGPMIFSPLSEIPAVGRNLLYIVTFFLFVILCVPMALVDNFAGIIVLRFLLGFFASPCLATAAASYGDMYGATEMPYVIALWGGGATLGPALGPIIGGFAVEKMDWRWSTWELLWLSGPVLILMFFFLPETSPDSILLRRAQRLRKWTGRTDLKSESEIRQKNMNPREITYQALIKPWQINALDPAVLFSTFYTGLTYGVYYSFFESFPLVYTEKYGFNLGQTGLCFLSVLIGLAVAVIILCAYLYFIAPKRLARLDPVPPEARIWPGLFATFCIPLGLFLFAFTARRSIHWIVSLVGVTISMCGTFIITQCMFIYLPFTYPRYSGSLFAANGLSRSLFAGAAILFSRPMFLALGIDGGVSLLAGFSVLCVFGIYGIYYFGESLRRRSKFAGE